MTDQPEQLVTGQLKDLGGLDLGALPHLDDSALGSMLARVLRRVDRPGASISGYNGAGDDKRMGIAGEVGEEKTPKGERP